MGGGTIVPITGYKCEGIEIKNRAKHNISFVFLFSCVVFEPIDGHFMGFIVTGLTSLQS